MHKTYDDVKDEHVGHTEENPDPTCYLCKKYGWIEEEKEEESDEPSEFMQNLIDDKVNRLEELEQAFDEHTLYDGSLRQKKKEYNRILDLLEEKGWDHDRKRKIIDSDEASGYQKKVY